MSTHRWHLLTGEYPPQSGGVSDYTYLVAAGLAASGAEVHVWAPRADGPTPEAVGVTVHRDCAGWSPAELRQIGEGLDACPGPRRLLVQYTPPAWGYKTLNFAFGRWLRDRKARGDDIWLMVHEAFYPIRLRDRPTRWVLPWGHRLMMRDALAASSRAFVSTPRYADMIRTQETGGRRPIDWLPVPSNIPEVHAPERVAALRHRLAPEGRALIGSFGASPGVRPLLTGALAHLLGGRTDRVGLILGRDGPGFREELAATHPELADRLVTPGSLSAEDTSTHIQACDVMAQPYPEGVSTRRGTVMATLAHGAAITTTFTPYSEPIWAETGCVATAPADDPAPLARATEALLSDPEARRQLGERARTVYEERFALRHTIEALLSP